MEGIKQPPGGRPPPQEPPEDDGYTTEQLALIRAAMMEELGAARKDTLPLHDRGPDVRDLQPLANRPRRRLGVTSDVAATWGSVTFDDVDPASREIDNIADGQLYRLRRGASHSYQQGNTARGGTQTRGRGGYGSSAGRGELRSGGRGGSQRGGHMQSNAVLHLSQTQLSTSTPRGFHNRPRSNPNTTRNAQLDVAVACLRYGPQDTRAQIPPGENPNHDRPHNRPTEGISRSGLPLRPPHIQFPTTSNVNGRPLGPELHRTQPARQTLSQTPQHFNTSERQSNSTGSGQNLNTTLPDTLAQAPTPDSANGEQVALAAPSMAREAVSSSNQSSGALGRSVWADHGFRSAPEESAAPELRPALDYYNMIREHTAIRVQKDNGPKAIGKARFVTFQENGDQFLEIEISTPGNDEVVVRDVIYLDTSWLYSEAEKFITYEAAFSPTSNPLPRWRIYFAGAGWQAHGFHKFGETSQVNRFTPQPISLPQGSIGHQNGPAPPATVQQSFTLSEEDNELLDDYFGSKLKNSIISLYRASINLQSAGHTNTPSFWSGRMPSQNLRTDVQDDIRRIFGSVLDSKDDPVSERIEILPATTQVVTQPESLLGPSPDSPSVPGPVAAVPVSVGLSMASTAYTDMMEASGQETLVDVSEEQTYDVPTQPTGYLADLLGMVLQDGFVDVAFENLELSLQEKLIDHVERQVVAQKGKPASAMTQEEVLSSTEFFNAAENVIGKFLDTSRTFFQFSDHYRIPIVQKLTSKIFEKAVADKFGDVAAPALHFVNENPGTDSIQQNSSENLNIEEVNEENSSQSLSAIEEIKQPNNQDETTPGVPKGGLGASRWAPQTPANGPNPPRVEDPRKKQPTPQPSVNGLKAPVVGVRSSEPRLSTIEVLQGQSTSRLETSKYSIASQTINGNTVDAPSIEQSGSRRVSIEEQPLARRRGSIQYSKGTLMSLKGSAIEIKGEQLKREVAHLYRGTPDAQSNSVDPPDFSRTRTGVKIVADRGDTYRREEVATRWKAISNVDQSQESQTPGTDTPVQEDSFNAPSNIQGSGSADLNVHVYVTIQPELPQAPAKVVRHIPSNSDVNVRWVKQLEGLDLSAQAHDGAQPAVHQPIPEPIAVLKVLGLEEAQSIARRSTPASDAMAQKLAAEFPATTTSMSRKSSNVNPSERLQSILLHVDPGDAPLVQDGKPDASSIASQAASTVPNYAAFDDKHEPLLQWSSQVSVQASTEASVLNRQFGNGARTMLAGMRSKSEVEENGESSDGDATQNAAHSGSLEQSQLVSQSPSESIKALSEQNTNATAPGESQSQTIRPAHEPESTPNTAPMPEESDNRSVPSKLTKPAISLNGGLSASRWASTAITPPPAPLQRAHRRGSSMAQPHIPRIGTPGRRLVTAVDGINAAAAEYRPQPAPFMPANISQQGVGLAPLGGFHVPQPTAAMPVQFTPEGFSPQPAATYQNFAVPGFGITPPGFAFTQPAPPTVANEQRPFLIQDVNGKLVRITGQAVQTAMINVAPPMATAPIAFNQYYGNALAQVNANIPAAMAMNLFPTRPVEQQVKTPGSAAPIMSPPNSIRPPLSPVRQNENFHAEVQARLKNSLEGRGPRHP